MASHFEIELDKLKTVIQKIGVLAENQVVQAVKALLSEPVTEGKEVKKTENKIDKLDVRIDEICQSIFALQQPVASDLRFIMSAMQISNEIERIGDLAISIIKKSNECFVTRDETTIGEIFLLNNSIKNESENAIHNIINEMKTNSKAVVSGTNLVIVIKHLERVSEHCTNIAEYVHFMINAKIIKHEKFDIKKSDN
jgi:phosphate transport system protein